MIVFRTFFLTLTLLGANLAAADTGLENSKIHVYLTLKGLHFDNLDHSKRTEFSEQAWLRVYTPFTPQLAGYLDVRAILRQRDRESFGESDTDNDIYGEVNELWLQWSDLFGVPQSAIKLGRAKLREERGWWWDENIESVRYLYRSTLWFTEIGIGERLTRGRIDEDERIDVQQNVAWLFGTASFQWRHQHYLEGRLLLQDDHDDLAGGGDIVDNDDRRIGDSDLIWLGLRAKGEAGLAGSYFTHLKYWADLGVVSGDETRLNTTSIGGGQSEVTATRQQDVSGWAVDLAATFETQTAKPLAITLGYALASGGDDGFRQPDLNRNRRRLSGPNRLRYYGEVLRPNLANLQILTAAAGIQLTPQLWLETLLHDYRQASAEAWLRDDQLDIDPSGNDKHLGQELDLVLSRSYRETLGYDLIAGVFRAGDAFEDNSGDLAYRLAFEVRYRF